MKILIQTMAAFAAVMAAPATAADFSFTGSLGNPNEVQLFNFSVGSNSNVTLRTYSYAGGTNAAGEVIARGGFDPILALFSSSGALIAQNDDGGCGVVRADAVTGACWDTFLRSFLTPGDYTVSVMAYSNFARGPNLSNGFSNTGSFDGRTNAWAFDILNVGQATQTGAVPEPSTWAMLILGFGAVGFGMRRRPKAALRYA